MNSARYNFDVQKYFKNGLQQLYTGTCMTTPQANEIFVTVEPKGEPIGSERNDVSLYPIKGGPCNVRMVDQGTH